MAVNVVGENKAKATQKVVPSGLEDHLPEVFLKSSYLMGWQDRPEWCSFGEAHRLGEHFRRVTMVGKAALARVVPEIYQDRRVKVTFDPVIGNNKEEKAAYISGSNLSEERGIVWELNSKSGKGDLWQDRVPVFGRYAERKVGRGVRDIMYFVHEYSHMLTEKSFWESGESYRSASMDLSMASRAVDEGLAILVERLVANELIKNYAMYGLSQSEASEVKVFIKARSDGLAQNRENTSSPEPLVVAVGNRAMAYNEGSEVMRQQFNAGGMYRIRELLAKLDSDKLLNTRRSDPKWKEVVEQPKKFLGLFGKI